ncbi:MAG: hypothetical protein WAL80_22510 [Xanthobacteraceae bacterium]|jgi:hypothetical protein
MATRQTSKSVVFHHPFKLSGVDRTLPPGDYRVVTDEEQIEEVSFPVYRRVATMIFVPAETGNASTVEMVTIAPQDLEAAQQLDVAHGA